MSSRNSRNIWKTLKRWYSPFLFVIPVLLTIALYFVFKKCSLSKEELSDLENKITFISWVFAGIMSLVSFSTIFLAFFYDNKLVSASDNLKSILFPYGLTTEELRVQFIAYQRSMVKDRVLNLLYWILLVIGCVNVFVWGTSAEIYSGFRIFLNHQSFLETIINLSVYAFVFILSVLLLTIVIGVNFVRHRKSPYENGYLPDVPTVISLDYLFNKSGDVGEFLLKNSPRVELFMNPPLSTPSYELKFHLPIAVKDLRFVIKLFDSDHRLVLRCFGRLENVEVVGRSFVTTLESNLDPNVYRLLSSEEPCSGELKIYMQDYTVGTRLFMKSVVEHDNIEFFTCRVIEHRDERDLDKGLIKKLGNQGNSISYQYEYDVHTCNP